MIWLKQRDGWSEFVLAPGINFNPGGPKWRGMPQPKPIASVSPLVYAVAKEGQ